MAIKLTITVNLPDLGYREADIADQLLQAVREQRDRYEKVYGKAIPITYREEEA